MKQIDKLVNSLASFPHSKTIANPYVEQYAVENLKHYFDYMFKQKGKKVLLVGEAPGYKGCRITGIPFTSGRVFYDISHPMLADLKEKIVLPSIESENTASIVWNFLADKETTPLFWNSFPFHPHPKDISNKNRAPNADELAFGSRILNDLHRIYRPELVAGVGQKGVAALEKIFPTQKIQYIRHPSYGGKEQFIRGMSSVI